MLTTIESSNEIERMFKDEVRTKKVTSYGAKHRTSRRGVRGPILYPSDFLSKTAQKDYKKPGEVVIRTMSEVLVEKYINETVPSKEQLLAMEYRDGKAIMQAMVAKFTNHVLMEKFGLTYSQLYTLQRHFNAFRFRNPRGSKVSISPPKVEVPVVIEAEVPKVVSVPIVSNKMLDAILSGKGNTVQQQLLAFAQMMVDDRDYVLTIKVEEKI